LFIIPFISILVNEFSREVSGFVRRQFSFLFSVFMQQIFCCRMSFYTWW